MAFNTEKKMEHFQQNWQNQILNEIWKNASKTWNNQLSLIVFFLCYHFITVVQKRQYIVHNLVGFHLFGGEHGV